MVATYGLQCVSFLISIGNRLNDVLDSSKLFNSSLDILWKPARSGGVKNGLNVSTANSSGWLAKVQFAMFEAIPVWTRMSSLGCQRFRSLAAMAPFFAWTSCNRRSDGRSGTVRPSGVLANKVACRIVLSSFFHRFVRSLLSVVLSSPMAANLDSLAARDSASRSRARLLMLLGGGVGMSGVLLTKVLCRFLLQFWELVSDAGLLAVCRFGIVWWLQKAQMDVSIGK